jgi:hypothetical protein
MDSSSSAEGNSRAGEPPGPHGSGGNAFERRDQAMEAIETGIFESIQKRP